MERRTFLKGALIAASTPGVVASGGADLSALGAEFGRLHARFLAAKKRADEAIATCEAKLKAAGIPVATDTWWSVRNSECDAAIKEWNNFGEAVEVVATKIRAAEASTAADLLVKARILPFDLSLQADHSEPRNEWNWDVECLQVFIEEMERFAGRQA